MDIRTKATKFGSLFQTSPKGEEISFDELLDAKISSFVKPIEEELYNWVRRQSGYSMWETRGLKMFV